MVWDEAKFVIVQSRWYLTSRSFSRPSSLAKATAPRPSEAKAPAASTEPKPNQPGNVKIPIESTTQKIAAEARRRLPSVTETYVAYGVSEKLVKECARQADYSIPQRYEKDASIPKTNEGEDLGVGSGWWYESMLEPCLCMWIGLILE